MYTFNFPDKKIMVTSFNAYKVGVFKIMYFTLWGPFLKTRTRSKNIRTHIKEQTG